jgi:ferredoxin
MKRQIIKIDEDKCTGCGDCIPNCHEGALQMIDGKARLISDLFCDGLGACIGHCPEDAISIEEREAEPYNERLVMEEMVKKGKNTVLAHLQHLKDHNAQEFLDEAIAYIKENNIDLSPEENSNENNKEMNHAHKHMDGGCGGGCPGSATLDFNDLEPAKTTPGNSTMVEIKSELRQWPVQMHLINPMAPHFKNSDLVLAADCVAFSMGNFHQKYLKDKTLAIACPKLDSNKDIYIEKLVNLIDQSEINTLSVIMMEVPCCGGLIQMAQIAQSQAKRKIPLKKTIISIQGEVLQEEWV